MPSRSHWFSLPLISLLTYYYYFNSAPFGADTHEVISVLCGHLTFPLQYELLRTDLRVYLCSVPAPLPRTNEALGLSLTFREGTGDLSYWTSTFFSCVFCSDLTNLQFCWFQCLLIRIITTVTRVGSYHLFISSYVPGTVRLIYSLT